MAQASRLTRKYRRARRERSLAFRALKAVASQRDYLLKLIETANAEKADTIREANKLEMVKIEGDSLA